MGGVNRALAAVPGFVPPTWWPAASNPTAEVSGVADAFPDVALEGNFLFVLLYFVIGLVFNIFGEEIYYRGYLLPKMRACVWKLGLGRQWRFIHVETCLPALVVPGNPGGRLGIRVHVWPSGQLTAGDDIPLDW